MMPAKPERHVALLRGINVGGKNMLPMKDLAAIFEDAGALEVRTYINSGNVIFLATAAIAGKIAPKVAKAIASDFRLQVPVVLRHAGELTRASKANPFLKSDAEENELYVAFLADRPTKSAIASLDPNRSPGDEWIVRNREVYLRLRNGAGKTKITNAWLDAKLATVSTLRNWRTVLKLVELTNLS